MASDPFYSMKAEVEEALKSILDERDMKRVLFDVEMLEDSIQRCLPAFARVLWAPLLFSLLLWAPNRAPPCHLEVSTPCVNSPRHLAIRYHTPPVPTTADLTGRLRSQGAGESCQIRAG